MADQPTMTAANDIETLLRDNDYNAAVLNSDAEMMHGPNGALKPVSLTLTIEVDL